MSEPSDELYPDWWERAGGCLCERCGERPADTARAGEWVCGRCCDIADELEADEGSVAA